MQNVYVIEAKIMAPSEITICPFAQRISFDVRIVEPVSVESSQGISLTDKEWATIGHVSSTKIGCERAAKKADIRETRTTGATGVGRKVFWPISELARRVFGTTSAPFRPLSLWLTTVLHDQQFGRSVDHCLRFSWLFPLPHYYPCYICWRRILRSAAGPVSSFHFARLRRAPQQPRIQKTDPGSGVDGGWNCFFVGNFGFQIRLFSITLRHV